MSAINMIAANAYSGATGLQESAPLQQSADVERPDFSKMMEESLDSAINTLHKNEQISQAGLMGEVSLDGLMIAVTQAETTLRTMVAIRDKMVAAYQEIIKMPI